MRVLLSAHGSRGDVEPMLRPAAQLGPVGMPLGLIGE